ncbi:MAG: putative Eukaryotic translation initiation factor 4E [Streblomastix strix]|uniref:Putative Eukaryotic translation initiation factor 4E n=1 Tax=Streblomastix strix TaxID=222440 RepID=A0A5J4WRF0_9EUKA|nr:MAG: putative Eukaryotic translation initiation factor 4E [Streblomastix strix]
MPTSLNSSWSFFFDRKSDYKTQDWTDKDVYLASLKKLGTFATVEDFWALHANIATVDKLANEVNLHCFRDPHRPCWEELPQGCSISLKFKEKKYRVKLWEDLLLSTIGENFQEPHVVGIELSTRVKEDCLTVWCNQSQWDVKARVEAAMRRILNLDSSVGLEFKQHIHSLRQYKSPSLPNAHPSNVTSTKQANQQTQSSSMHYSSSSNKQQQQTSSAQTNNGAVTPLSLFTTGNSIVNTNTGLSDPEKK